MNSPTTRNSPNWLLSNIERNAFLLFQSSICCVKFTLFKDCSPLTLIVLLVYTLEESTFVPVWRDSETNLCLGELKFKYAVNHINYEIVETILEAYERKWQKNDESVFIA